MPSLLTQHHGNPPPGAEDMAAWLNSIRKRHAKHYQKLQKEVEDLAIQKEVKEGVEKSIALDKTREANEAKAEAERKALEEAEAKRAAAVVERRKTFLESLPDDATGQNSKRIALRFPDGRKGDRGFDSGLPLSAVFNWVDGMYEIEREKVVLTSMNGKMSFEWDADDERTLENVGLGKSTAFRVSEKAEDEEKTKLVL